MAIEFTVDHDHTARDDDAEIQLQGWIDFLVDNRPNGDFRVRYSDPPKTLNLPVRHGWLGDDGHMYADQAMTAPFRLTANDPAFNTEHLTYRAVPHLTTPLGAPVDVPVFYFAAPDTDTTLYLTRVMQMPEQPVMKVRTHGYAEDILDATTRGIAVLNGDETEASEAIDADTYRAYLTNRNGTTDDRAVLAAADTAALAANKPLMLLTGSHKVNSNLTITSPVAFRPGAKIKPASGVTVILAGGVVGNDGQAQIFDQSLGGKCIPKKVPGLHPGWWGPTGSADDSQTWEDMVTACAADSADQPYKQRIFVPVGENRLWQIDIRNFDLIGWGRSSQILPPDTATPGDPVGAGTGYVVKLMSATTVDGVDFKDGAIDGITVVFLVGSKVHMVNGRVVMWGANSVGIWTGTRDGQSGSTPKFTNFCIEGVPGYASAESATGLKIQTTDGEVVNVTIHDLGIGIQLSSTSWVFSETHVYQCQTGISGFGWDTRFIGCQVADCFGWGISFHQGCVYTTWDSGTKIWRNGLDDGGTGGIYLKKPSGGSCHDNRIDGRFDDNVGTSLYLEGAENTTGDLRVVSTITTAGAGSPPGTTGIYVDSDCRGTELRIRTGPAPVVTGKLVDNHAGEATVVDVLNPVASTVTGDTGAENGANTWAKLATFTSDTEFADFNALYAFTANYASSGENGLLSVRCRNNADDADPSGSVQVLALGGRSALTPDSFKLIFGAFGDPFELWVRKNVDYLDVRLRELTSSDKMNWAVTHSALAAWQSATPTGTVGNRSSITPDLPSSSTTATAAGTLTMTLADAPIQIFTGSTTHTVNLPTTGVKAGAEYVVINQSSGVVTVRSSGANTIGALNDGSSIPTVRSYRALQDSPTAATHWRETLTVAPARASTATSAGTTTLVASDAEVQEFTGSTTQTVKLPTTGVTVGRRYTIINNSTGVVTVQSSDGSTLLALPASRLVEFEAKADAPTTTSQWGVSDLSPSTSAFAPSTLAMRDGNSNVSAVNFFTGTRSTAASAGTLTVAIADYRVQIITGSTTHTVQLPTTSVTAGMEWLVISQSTGDVTVQSSGGNTIGSALSGGSSSAPVAKRYIALVDTPTTAAHWLGI